MARPVDVFLRQSLMLKAACAACVDDPKPKPVHHVRSASRRMEATIELLAAKAGIADLRSSSKSLRKSLRKIRKAAGEVRDLDVHRELIDGYGKSGAVSKLDDDLRRSRKKAARKLRKRLQKDERKIHHALDDLETALKPALDLDLRGEELAGFARSWFAGAVRTLDVEQDDQLHSVRKACKTARYLAEADAEGAKDAKRVAARFEAVQKTLGEWHDRLLLIEEAKTSLGSDDPLVGEIEADCQKLRHQGSVAAESVMGSAKGQRPPAAEVRKRTKTRRATAR